MRRTPQQARSEKRVASLLAAAESVFSERGFDVATMTEIADKAAVSIGSLYQYFPNRAAIATALRTAYGAQMDRRWSDWIDEARVAPLAELVRGLVDLVVAFVDDHPAYLQLVQASVKSARTPKDRLELRKRFADLLVLRSPALDARKALAIAEVALMIVKGLVSLYASASAAERPRLRTEVVTALTAYLQARLGA
ncbi:DNA-binding transcriptional regulator, AcrR family [Chitinasiproducens palmae]|uniref:DNA-binding transcriptional regulator, AcrR family n=2 Tax=Chitinasiproducens palmae TaxID=1770053 RepID=A0A1H2PUD4_9BURK|nr:DNA-binding transcriptional regulator, AcrR family [Chitinasiproducens palmae]